MHTNTLTQSHLNSSSTESTLHDTIQLRLWPGQLIGDRLATVAMFTRAQWMYNNRWLLEVWERHSKMRGNKKESRKLPALLTRGVCVIMTLYSYTRTHTLVLGEWGREQEYMKRTLFKYIICLFTFTHTRKCNHRHFFPFYTFVALTTHYIFLLSFAIWHLSQASS